MAGYTIETALLALTLFTPAEHVTRPVFDRAVVRRRSRRRREYQEYINSPQWRRRRLRALQLAGWVCERCGAAGPLHVHHLRYFRNGRSILGRERDEDLEAVCPPCHRRAHRPRRLHRRPPSWTRR